MKLPCKRWWIQMKGAQIKVSNKLKCWPVGGAECKAKRSQKLSQAIQRRTLISEWVIPYQLTFVLSVHVTDIFKNIMWKLKLLGPWGSAGLKGLLKKGVLLLVNPPWIDLGKKKASYHIWYDDISYRHWDYLYVSSKPCKMLSFPSIGLKLNMNVQETLRILKATCIQLFQLVFTFLQPNNGSV